jgi:hypothetical protein
MACKIERADAPMSSERWSTRIGELTSRPLIGDLEFVWSFLLARVSLPKLFTRNCVQASHARTFISIVW